MDIRTGHCISKRCFKIRNFFVLHHFILSDQDLRQFLDGDKGSKRNNSPEVFDKISFMKSLCAVAFCYLIESGCDLRQFCDGDCYDMTLLYTSKKISQI